MATPPSWRDDPPVETEPLDEWNMPWPPGGGPRGAVGAGEGSPAPRSETSRRSTFVPRVIEQLLRAAGVQAGVGDQFGDDEQDVLGGGAVVRR
ncbi:hypothetical protein GCM10020221_02580 [Streptomyces thioluteus]|uniref:Uncharacterized protein n=1 Tax=Streptomyces thioluteus TaxID=66431 RepID=A0ABN3WCE5_STRTU